MENHRATEIVKFQLFNRELKTTLKWPLSFSRVGRLFSSRTKWRESGEVGTQNRTTRSWKCLGTLGCADNNKKTTSLCTVYYIEYRIRLDQERKELHRNSIESDCNILLFFYVVVATADVHLVAPLDSFVV